MQHSAYNGRIGKALLSLLFLSLLFSIATATPPLPCEFYGTATINGEPAPIGTVIIAYIDTSLCGTIITTEEGVYGDGPGIFDRRLIVEGAEGDENKIITFWINGLLAEQTSNYTAGVCKQLNFTAYDPPTADFDADPTGGIAPLTVQFTDRSSGMRTGWNWTFGDGGTSTDQHPTHEYSDAGIYTVSLQVTSPWGENTSVKMEYIHAYNIPITKFIANVTVGNTPLAVQFTDLSTGDPTNWLWTFGDGATSTEQHPAHTYEHAGIYTVSLNASNPYGFNVSTVTNAILTLAAPVADFTHTPNEGNAPLTVNFTDASTGNVTSWHWDFGDGNTSNEQNPAYIYATTGTYAVSLNASNVYGFNISTVTDAIVVLDPPVAEFTFTPEEGNAPLTVRFTDTSTGDNTRWNWDFGEGTGSSEQNPIHTYASAGTYTVSLNASNTYGWNISTVVDAILVLPAPVAGFTFSPEEGNAPLTVTFTDDSTGNVTGWSWDFGDGEISTEQSPTHTYAASGIYTVSLNASNTFGFNIATVSDAVHVLSPPISHFTYTPDEGNAPLTVTFTDTSTGSVTAWHWDFGDGNISTEQNPSHIYASTGTYAVLLNASNAYGFNISTVTDAIQVFAPPVADFTYTPDEGNAPLTVNFTDASTGSVTVWHWDFGDDSGSFEQNPTHTYADAGNYTVRLNASNAYGFNILTASNAVRVLPAPAADFMFAPSEGYAPLTVSFTDASTGNVTAWAWQFGDGNGSTLQNPVHTYAIEGTYTVSLNVSNAYGSSVSTVTDAIHVLKPPVSANFTVNVTTGHIPLAVRFTDLSAGDPANWFWAFGDGNTSTEQHPVHTYRIPGTYTVNLTASSSDHSDTHSKQAYIHVKNAKGDFNGDGVVDIGDVSRVAYMVVGKTPADPDADFNENGAVDIGDAAKIAYFFIGKIPGL